MSTSLLIRELGLRTYDNALTRMREFTDVRDQHTNDELWVLQHEPVFTMGQAALEKHLLNPAQIPVVKSDRGGQVTYHGPGQLVVYTLIDLQRKKMGVREFVTGLEQVLIDTLEQYGIAGQRKAGAPGVYVGEDKIAALGLRVRRGRTMHGISLNVDMDLSPFEQINPCGYEGLKVVQMRDYFFQGHDCFQDHDRFKDNDCFKDNNTTASNQSTTSNQSKTSNRSKLSVAEVGKEFCKLFNKNFDYDNGNIG